MYTRMIRYRFSLAILVVFFFQANGLFAQETPPNQAALHLIAKSYGDSIVLRWAPDKPAAWMLGNRHGYSVERAFLGVDSTFDKSSFARVGPDTLKTWSLDEMKARLARDDAFAAVAAQAVYGESFTPSVQNIGTQGLFNLALEQENRYSFALFAADNSPGVAQALALRWTDKQIDRRGVYLYRVFSHVPRTDYQVDTAYLLVNAGDVQAIPSPPALIATGGEKHVALEWDVSLHRSHFTGYHVERGDARERNFTWLTKVPIVLATPDEAKQEAYLASHVDSMERNYLVYTYRLRGITPFGEISPPSNTVKASGRDRTPPAPITQIEARGLDERRIEIKWTKTPLEPDMKGFIVEHAVEVDGPYAPVHEKHLARTATSFIDSRAYIHSRNYYRVLAVDTANNASVSFSAYAEIIDSIPPAQPAGLTGYIDTSGIAHLQWPLGKEKDLLGYRVFFANQADHEFTNLTPYPVADSLFTDTISLNSLTKSIFYRLVAVDWRYNHSKPSEILELKRPDKIPPVKPLFSDIRVSDTLVEIKWTRSHSEDLAKEILYRKTGSTAWVKIDEFPSGKAPGIYNDKQVKPKETYYYTLEAIDQAGLSSGYNHPVSAYIPDYGIRPPIRQFTAKRNPGEPKVELSWQYSASADVYFVIYRGIDGINFTVYKSVPGTKVNFTDIDLVGKGTYEYAMKAVHRDGGESALSQRVKIVVD